MKKKSIVFVSHPLVCGGVERTLLSVLSILPEEKFDLTLLLTEKSGVLLSEVPSHVKIVEVPFASLDRYELKHGRVPTLKYCLWSFHWFHAARMLWLRFVWTFHGRKGDYNLRVIRGMMRRVDVKQVRTQFDFAFAYAGGLLAGSIVHDLIRAQITAIWSHSEKEIGLMQSDVYEKLYTHFTHRFATGQMVERLNEMLKGRLARYEKLPLYIDPALYRRMVGQAPGFTDSYKGLRILTVGRLSYQKGIDEAIRIAVRLKAENLEFHWYVVGGGEDREKLQKQIDESGVGDRFILLGEFLNPYPFFSQCHIYAQPSRWEAFCLTVSEAKTFNKPILVTDFVGAREQLQDGKTGLIVPVGDYELFYHKLKELIKEESLRSRLSFNVAESQIGTSEAVKGQWLSLLNER